jgi:hypothetical protein
VKSEDSGCHALNVKGASISQEDEESTVLYLTFKEEEAT